MENHTHAPNESTPMKQTTPSHPQPIYNPGQYSSPLSSPPMVNSSPNTPVQPHQGGYPLPEQPQGDFQNGQVYDTQQQLQTIPIEALQSQSAPVVCPSCGVRVMTRATPEAGMFMHGIAAIVCLISCLGCIPYFISSLKDVHHACGNCGMPLAIFHRSGRTEIETRGK